MKKISELTGISGTVQNENILVINTAGGTKKITYGQLCAAVKATLGIRNVAEGIEITEPEMLMDGKIASEKFMELDEAITQLNGDISNLLKGLISNLPTIDHGTAEGIEAELNSHQQKSENNSIYFASIRTIDVTAKPPSFPLVTAVYLMMGYKYNSNGTYGYGFQLFIPYANDTIYIRRYLNNTVSWGRLAISDV